MKKLRYPALVREEAKNLLKFSTREERANLNFEEFSPENSFECIYGQMTGNCFSPRAEQLIKQCASKVYDGTATSIGNEFLSKKLVGTPKRR